MMVGNVCYVGGCIFYIDYMGKFCEVCYGFDVDINFCVWWNIVNEDGNFWIVVDFFEVGKYVVLIWFVVIWCYN